MSTADLQGEVQQLRSEVAALAEGVVGLARDRAASRVRSFLLEDDAETARLMLEDLRAWLDAVWVQYPDHGLPECWAHHPSVVEELWAAMGVHRACFRAGGTWQAFADWQNRYRPAVAARIQGYAPSCAFSQHEPGSDFDPATAPPDTGLADLGRVAEHWTSAGVPPYPNSCSSAL